MTNLLLRIANHYGKLAQAIKCVEELCELAVALLHNDYANIVEEIADVEVMIAQVKHLFGITDHEVESVKKRKLMRQIERMEREQDG